jgi:hypothetical protein
VKQGIKWFNVFTTVWAVALVTTAALWFAAPAFAGGGGMAVECTDFCIAMELCEDGCQTAPPSRTYCRGECNGGGTWECWIDPDV